MQLRNKQLNSDSALTGELGVFSNPNGGESTEVSTTVTHPSLNGGRPTNIPMLVEGQSPEAIQRILSFRPSQEDQAVAVRRAVERQSSGQSLPWYDSIQLAEDAAKARSSSKQPTAQPSSKGFLADLQNYGGPFGLPSYRFLSKARSSSKQPAAPPEAYTGGILPISRDAGGDYSLAMPEMVQGWINAVQMGNAYSSRQVPYDDPDYIVTDKPGSRTMGQRAIDEVTNIGMETAVTSALGGAVTSIPKGALASLNIKQRQLVDILKKSPPANKNTGGIGSAYWNGFNGVKNKYDKQSLAHAAWVSGKDAAKPISRIRPPTYSRALEFIANSPQGKAPGAQWRATMKSAGVKDEEIAWLGLDDFLADPKAITRADLEAHIRANEVRVEDVNKGAGFEGTGLTVQQETRLNELTDLRVGVSAATPLRDWGLDTLSASEREEYFV